MKVNKKSVMKRVEDLETGDVFRQHDNYYLVLNRYDSSKAMQLCADIETGECTYFNYDMIVDCYEVEVLIK